MHTKVHYVLHPLSRTPRMIDTFKRCSEPSQLLPRHSRRCSMSEKELATKTLLELLLANANGQDRQGQGQVPCEGEHGVPGHRAPTDARALLEGLLPKPPEATPSPDQSASQDREAAVAALVSVADALTASDNLEQARGQRRSPAAANPHRTPQQDPELQLQPRKRARHGEAGPGPGPGPSTSTLTSLPALCISEPVTAALPAWLLPPVPQPQPQPPPSGVYGGCVPLESLQQITQVNDAPHCLRCLCCLLTCHQLKLSFTLLWSVRRAW